MTKSEQSKYIGLKMLFLLVLANVGEKDNSAANEHNVKIKARTELKKYFKIKKKELGVELLTGRILLFCCIVDRGKISIG